MPNDPVDLDWKKSCLNCRFSQDRHGLECHFGPPTYIPGTYMPGRPEDDDYRDPFSAWPEVDENDWCGKWQAKS